MTAVSAAIPAFVAAIVLIMVFAVKLGWFPALGNGTGFLSNVRHFTLPAIALAIVVARDRRPGHPGRGPGPKAAGSTCRPRSAAASRPG